MSNAVYTVGSVVTCQIGNPTDTRGYMAEAQVMVLGHVTKDHMQGRPLYLIKVIGKDMVGRASVPNPNPGSERLRVTTQLYCTAACSWGAGNPRVQTLEDAVKCLF